MKRNRPRLWIFLFFLPLLQGRLLSVNEAELTFEDLPFLLVKEIGLGDFRKIMDQTVVQMLISQYARKQGISISDQQVNDFLQQMMGEKLNDFSALFGEGTMKKWAEIQLLFDIMVQQKEAEVIQNHQIQVSDKEIKDYYWNNIQKMVKPETARFQFIFAIEPSKIKAIEEELQKGTEFSVIAQNYSRAQEWDTVRPISREQLSPLFPQEVVEKVFSTPEKQVEKIAIKMGTFWIYVLEKKPAVQPSLDEMKGQIRQLLLREKADPYIQQWFQEVMKELPVHFDLGLMKELLTGEGIEEAPALE